MVKAGIAIILALLAALLGYYYYGYAPEILERTTQQALNGFSHTLTTRDRAKIKDDLKSLLTDNAHIRLEVSFISLNMQNTKPETEEFDTPTFLTFIDNTLYSLDDYGATAHIQDFRLELGKKSASLIFNSESWGESESSYGDTKISMRANAEIKCDAHVAFDSIHPVFDSADCKVKIFTHPKAGEESKMLQSPDALKQLLR